MKLSCLETEDHGLGYRYFPEVGQQDESKKREKRYPSNLSEEAWPHLKALQSFASAILLLLELIPTQKNRISLLLLVNSDRFDVFHQAIDPLPLAVPATYETGGPMTVADVKGPT